MPIKMLNNSFLPSLVSMTTHMLCAITIRTHAWTNQIVHTIVVIIRINAIYSIMVTSLPKITVKCYTHTLNVIRDMRVRTTLTSVNQYLIYYHWWLPLPLYIKYMLTYCVHVAVKVNSPFCCGTVVYMYQPQGSVDMYYGAPYLIYLINLPMRLWC